MTSEAMAASGNWIVMISFTSIVAQAARAFLEATDRDGEQ